MKLMFQNGLIFFSNLVRNPYQSYEWAKIHEETSEAKAYFLWLKHMDIEAGLLVLNKKLLHGTVSYSFSVGGPLCPILEQRIAAIS